MQKLGIDFLTVTRNEKLTEGFIQYNRVDEKIITAYPVIINCTPVGMSPDEGSYPGIPYQFLNVNHYLYDLVYKPAKTLFLQKGEERGAAIMNGYEMLLIQAEASWKIWNSD